MSSFPGQWFSKRFKQPLCHQLVLFVLAKSHSPISCPLGLEVPPGVGAWPRWVLGRVTQCCSNSDLCGKSHGDGGNEAFFLQGIPLLGCGCPSFPVDVLVLGKGARQEVLPLGLLASL